MISTTELQKIHSKLQAIYPHGTVLLSGSYLTGEADSGSDLDFTLLTDSFFYFNYYRQHKDIFAEIKKQYPQASLTIWPRGYARHGWHYVYGRRVGGAIFHSPVDKKCTIRTCLKLAYFAWLRGVAAGDERFLIQTVKRLAIAQIVDRSTGPIGDLDFSRRFVLTHVDLLDDEMRAVVSSVLIDGKADTETWRVVRKLLLRIENDLSHYLNFSLVNYLLYNLKFLSRGSGQFLFKNPDRYLVGEMKRGLDSGADFSALCRYLDPIIFPIIVL